MGTLSPGYFFYFAIGVACWVNFFGGGEGIHFDYYGDGDGGDGASGAPVMVMVRLLAPW